ncbi:MAG: hypothetical protein AAFR21_04155 [Pseudomonadota bacterium]
MRRFAKRYLPNGFSDPLRRLRQSAWRASALNQTLKSLNAFYDLSQEGAGPQITYLVKEGLTNRLKSHIIAAHIAKETGRFLQPIWRATPECNAMYTDLFVSGETQFAPPTFHRLVYYDETTNKASPSLHELLEIEDDLLVLDLNWQYARMGRLIEMIGGPQAFREIVRETLPVRDDLLTIADARRTDWPQTVIGVHIRFGDFVKFDQAIGIDRYITAVRAALERLPNAAVFVASDATVNQLQPFFDAMSNQRVLFEESPPRDDVTGVQNALIDILLLSSCDRLVLTPLSGFGDFAARWGDVPCDWA